MSGRDYEFLESTLRWERTVESEDLSGGLQGKSEERQLTEPTDNDEARNDFGSAQGHFINCHHSEPRVQLYVPKAKEETFPIPLKIFDVTRSTQTNVMQEKRIDDYWNVDENRGLSDSWTGLTKFTVLKEEPPKGYVWSGWRLTKVQTTTRPDHVWPEVWTQITKAEETERNLPKFLEPSESRKSCLQTVLWNLAIMSRIIMESMYMNAMSI